ncbi:MAG: DUF362 domain-containing protein [Ruminococcaceae bacterium]|nr:DUF362 domain-containing protein [Oscillospiraceae bacterium]
MKSKPEEAVVTDPSIISAIIDYLIKREVKSIVICDSPGGLYNRNRLKAIYEAAGYLKFENEIVELNYDTESEEVPSHGSKVSSFDIIKPILEADIFINVAKLKTHAMAGLTAAVKNNFGTVPGLRKSEFHCTFPKRIDFCDMLVELCTLVSPEISIVDGVLGMEGNGPSGGIPRNFGIIAGSRNPFLLDRVLCEYMGMNVEDALTVKSSIGAGFCPREVKDINIEGDIRFPGKFVKDLIIPESVESDFSVRVPKPFRRIARKVLDSFAARPIIDSKKCIGCRMCHEICPAKVISIVDKKAVIDKKECIRCFCCHEVCPERAIDIKRSFFWRI